MRSEVSDAFASAAEKQVAAASRSRAARAPDERITGERSGLSEMSSSGVLERDRDVDQLVPAVAQRSNYEVRTDDLCQADGKSGDRESKVAAHLWQQPKCAAEAVGRPESEPAADPRVLLSYQPGGRRAEDGRPNDEYPPASHLSESELRAFVGLVMGALIGAVLWIVAWLTWSATHS